MDLHSEKWKRKTNAPPLSGYAEVATQKWLRRSGYSEVATQKWLLRSGYSGKYFHDDCDLGQSSRSADPGYEPLILGRANRFETPESVSYIPCAQRLESHLQGVLQRLNDAATGCWSLTRAFGI